MRAYIILLRGINVGGHRKVKMAELRALLEKQNFKNVQTYIQSGNIVFQSTRTILEIQDITAGAIEQHFGFEVPVVVLNKQDVASILLNCPFTLSDQEASYYTILSQVPLRENIALFETIKYPEEEIILIDRCVYFYTTKGMGRAKYSNNLVENKLGVTATTRNHRTLTRLLEMLSNT